jgi:hypothetical protein
MNNSIYNPNNGLIPKSMVPPNSNRNSLIINPYKIDSSTNNQQSMLKIYNAFTGLKVVVLFDLFTSMDGFKAYISQALKIDIERLFLLTPFGVKLKFSMIVHEQITEVFAFDRKFFNPKLVKEDFTDTIVKELLSNIENEEMTYMIKPRESPISANSMNETFNSFIEKLTLLTSRSQTDENIILNSSDLDFDNLRLFLNLLKRNSGWASALLADMKSSLFNDIYHHDYEVIENILKALNSLIQYISNLFTNLEKEFNTILDVFTSLSNASSSDTWKSAYALLENIMFTYTDKTTTHTNTLVLSDLIDLQNIEKSAKNLKIQSNRVNKYFVELKTLITEDIIRQKDSILDDFELYKTLYLKPHFEDSEKENITKASKIFQELELVVSKLINEVSKLPSFEELITTSNQMSTFLSQDAINKIITLIDFYKLQSLNYVPKITKLSGDLYQIQRKFLDSRQELQTKILNYTLLSIVQIQLSIRDASKILNSDILTNIEKMQHNELQLTLVNDLPMIFGIWTVAVLGNKKYGVSINKLARKTNEVFGMLNFMEQNTRSQWLTGFIASIGIEKNNLIFLNEERYRNKFISDNLFSYLLLPENQVLSDAVSPFLPKRNSSDIGSYFTPLNKLIQNINGFPIKNKVDERINSKIQELVEKSDKNELLGQYDKTFFDGLINSIKLQDIENYINSLKKYDYDSVLLKQLLSFLENIGITQFNRTSKNNDEIIIKSENFEDLGTFDASDQHYMKIFEKFIKSFESNQIKIDIKLGKQEIEKKSNIDKGLIKAYEERITKLENLLHEKKFQIFNHKWSQVSSENLKFLDLEDGEEIISNENGNLLGRKTIKLPPSHYFQKLKTFEQRNTALEAELLELKKNQNFEEMMKLKQLVDQKNKQIKLHRIKEEEYKKNIDSKDLTIEKLKEKLEKLNLENSNLKQQNIKLSDNIEELNSMNKDLLENMTHKEAEYLSENQVNQKETNDLKLRIEELIDLTNQYKLIFIKVKETEGLINKTLSVLFFMLNKLKDLTDGIYSNVRTFSLILEILGLLLMKDDDGRIVIQRVKGLRLQKKRKYLKQQGIDEEVKSEDHESEEFVVDDEKLFLTVIASDLIDDINSSVNWIPHLSEGLEKLKIINTNDTGSSIAEHENEENYNNNNSIEKLYDPDIKEIEETLESLKNHDSMLEYIIEKCPEPELEQRYTNFIEKTNINPDFMLARIHKRFEDVESLARKLQREKVQLRIDIKTLTKKLSQQLVLKNFEKGDLVLFLKTLTPAAEDVPNTISGDGNKRKQPWAVFNIGSPNYYMKGKSDEEMAKLEQKEWFVGRIDALEKHVITTENKDSLDENPFNLAVNTVWYYVETKEELMRR